MSEMTNDEVGATLDTLAEEALGSSPEPQTAQPEAETKETEAKAEETKEQVEAKEEVVETTPEKPKAQVPLSRFQEVYGELKSSREEREALKKEIAEIKQNLPQRELTPEEQQLKAAEAQLQQMGYAKKEEISKEWEAKLDETLRRAEADKQIEVELAQLEKTHDGKDGLPKFDRQEIVNFMAERKLTNLSFEEAYNLKHNAEIIDAKIKAATMKNVGTFSEASDGSGADFQDLNTLKKQMLKGDKKAKDQYLDALIS